MSIPFNHLFIFLIKIPYVIVVCYFFIFRYLAQVLVSFSWILVSGSPAMSGMPPILDIIICISCKLWLEWKLNWETLFTLLSKEEKQSIRVEGGFFFSFWKERCVDNNKWYKKIEQEVHNRENNSKNQKATPNTIRKLQTAAYQSTMFSKHHLATLQEFPILGMQQVWKY